MNVPATLKYADSHEWMRAEADGKTDDSGAGQYRRDIDFEFTQDGQNTDGNHGDRERSLDECAERARPLEVLDCVDARGGLVTERLLEPAGRGGDGLHHEISHDNQ